MARRSGFLDLLFLPFSLALILLNILSAVFRLFGGGKKPRRRRR